MKILSITPSFSDKDVERSFYDAIVKLPAYSSIKLIDCHFLLELDNELMYETIAPLTALYDHWGIDKSPLDTLNEMVNKFISEQQAST